MSNSLLEQLNTRRLTIWEQAKAILDACETEGRDMSADEGARFDQASTDMDSIAARAAQIEQSERVNREVEETLVRALGHGNAGSGSAQPDQTEAGLRAFLRGETRHYEAPQTRGHVGSRESRIRAERRDLVKGTTTAGGFLIPTTLYGSLVEYANDSSGVLQAGPTILNTAGGENIDVPYVTAYGSGALTAEATAIAESDPAFAKRTLGAYKYGQIVQVSRELIDDEVFDIVSFVARTAGRNIGLALGVDLAVGNGSAKPSGIMQTATLGKTGGTGVVGAFTTDDLIDLQMSVLSSYRNSPSAAWIVRDATLGGIRKLKDGAGRYIFDPATGAGSLDSLLGKPIYTDPNIAAVATSAKSVLFGDISQYFVRLAGGARFERSDEFAFNADLVTFRAVLRADGLLVDQTGAVKYFVGAGT